jgi:hypothetical protein
MPVEQDTSPSLIFESDNIQAVQREAQVNIDPKSQRVLIWAGVVLANFYAMAFIYLMGLFPLPLPSLGAEAALEFYSRSNLQFKFGVVIMVLSSSFYLLWTVVIAAQMARIEKGFPLWTLLMTLASVLGTWAFAFPPLIWGAAAFLVERNPEITLMLHQFAFLIFVGAGGFFMMQLVPIAVVAFSANNKDKNTAFPRWLGWVSLWDGMLGPVGVMAFVFNHGPFAWNGLISFWLPLLLFTIWLVALLYCLLRAIKRQEQVQGQAQAGAAVLPQAVRV